MLLLPVVIAIVEKTHHPEYFEELMSKWRKFYPEANISIGTLDGEEYMPPAPPSRGGKAPSGGGYFALPTAADDMEEEEEVSLNDSTVLSSSSRATSAPVPYGRGSSAVGILQQDQLTGSNGGRNSDEATGSSFIV